MTNVNADHQGLTVTTLDTRHRRFPVDFPGWGAANAADTLLPIPAGLTGVITSVESHGIAPYTRYSVRFADGTHASGLVLGTDIKLEAAAMASTAKTPGFNCRLVIFFAATKSGKPRAYYWSARQFRAFPLPLVDAEIMRATETADVIHCHPMRPCETCKSAS